MALHFYLRCFWYVLHIYNFSSNDFTGWDNSALRMWYFLYLNNLIHCWYWFNGILCKYNKVLCFTCCRKFWTLSHPSVFSWYLFFDILLVFLDFLGTLLFDILFVRERFLCTSFFDILFFSQFSLYLVFWYIILIFWFS